MSRKAKFIALREFESKLNEALDFTDEGGYSRYQKSPLEINNKIGKDLNKIQFDWENWDLLKVEEVEAGLPIAWFRAGGDWEYPVHFILYWDGKGFRGYIPEVGNSFDTKYRTAYGSQSESKFWEEEGKTYEDEQQEEPSDNEKEDFGIMEIDVLLRIKVEP